MGWHQLLSCVLPTQTGIGQLNQENSLDNTRSAFQSWGGFLLSVPASAPAQCGLLAAVIRSG